MTDIIVSVKLPSFYAVLHNARVRFCAQSSLLCNGIVIHFSALDVFECTFNFFSVCVCVFVRVFFYSFFFFTVYGFL